MHSQQYLLRNLNEIWKMIERNYISKLWKFQQHFSRCTWSTISLSLPSLTSLQLSAIYLSPLGGETKKEKTSKAWLLDKQKKVWKCWSSKLQGDENDTPLHCVDTSIATAPVSDFLELGSNLWNWKKCAKLEKVRKIGRNSNRMWTNLYHPCKILGNIVLFGSRSFSHFTVSPF